MVARAMTKRLASFRREHSLSIGQASPGRPGVVIDVNNETSPKTRRRFYEIAAAIADHFSSTTPGRREQRSR